jgi:hypothetical protein
MPGLGIALRGAHPPQPSDWSRGSMAFSWGPCACAHRLRRSVLLVQPHPYPFLFPKLSQAQVRRWNIPISHQIHPTATGGDRRPSRGGGVSGGWRRSRVRRWGGEPAPRGQRRRPQRVPRRLGARGATPWAGTARRGSTMRWPSRIRLIASSPSSYS